MPDRVPSSERSTFAVVERRRGGTLAVILRTDDWVAAETAALTPWPRDVDFRSVKGTHPTHDWNEQSGRCRACGAWNNGSYGSHAPCGYDWHGYSLTAALDRERETCS